jgi:hypothetical protein
MLRAFAEQRDGYHMTIGQAQVFDQRPFRSMLIQKWVAFRPGKGFHITREGREAWRDYHETEIFRKNPVGPLTSYFDAAAYGLKTNVRVMGGAA